MNKWRLWVQSAFTHNPGTTGNISSVFERMIYQISDDQKCYFPQQKAILISKCLSYLTASVFRFSDLWNFLATNFLTNIWQFSRLKWKSITFKVKSAVPPFWALLGKFGQLFVLTSSHTVNGRKLQKIDPKFWRHVALPSLSSFNNYQKYGPGKSRLTIASKGLISRTTYLRRS